MLAGDVDLINGMRRICVLRFHIDDPEHDVFLTIRALESETDWFPVGVTRSNFSEDYLKRADVEMADYLENSRIDILTACQEIICAFS